MVTIEEVEIMLDELAEELPPEFYEKLNGGILLLPQAKLHPEGRADDLYILGEYHHNFTMGRYIVIYYGSFEQIYGHLSEEKFKEQLRKTLRHEFTHHIESLAGDRGLEIKDKEKLNEYKRNNVED